MKEKVDTDSIIHMYSSLSSKLAVQLEVFRDMVMS